MNFRVFTEEDWNTNEEFFAQLGAKPSNINIAEDDGTDDADFEKRHSEKLKLFR